TLVYPGSPGSGAEILTRTMATRASQALGQPVVVDVRSGANMRLAAIPLLAARGDAHILSLAYNSTLVAEPLRDSSFKFDPGRDYTAVVAMFLGPTMIALHPSLPFRDMAGLVAYVKANPGKFNMGVGTSGGMGSILTALVNERVGLDITPVPYK